MSAVHRLRYALIRRDLRARQNARKTLGIADAAARTVRFHGALATLAELEKRLDSGSPLVFLRFGDGDVNLVLGASELMQSWTPAVGIEMAEAMALAGPGVMKSLPLQSDRFGADPYMEPGFHLGGDDWAMEILGATAAFVRTEELWSPVPLSYAVAFEPSRVGRFLVRMGGPESLIVTDRAIAADVGFLLRCRSHVGVPSHDAFSGLDSAEATIANAVTGGGVRRVVVAAGCAGRILTKRLALRFPALQLVDPGSIIDALVGRDSRAWMEFVDQRAWRELRRSIAGAV